MQVEKSPLVILVAFVFSLALPAFGYIYLGQLVAFLFLLGDGGGLALWILFPTTATYSSIKYPYWVTLSEFLRALTLEGGPAASHSMLAGVVLSIAGLIAISWLLLRFSARLPVRQIFTVSSALMVILAVILAGKGTHALQETGAVSVSSTPWEWSTELLGVYTSWQPLIAQALTAIVVLLVWRLGSRPAISVL